MIKIFAIGLWVCVASLGSSYLVASMSRDSQAATTEGEEPTYFAGLDYRKTDPITVPIIDGNEIRGYVLARFVYTIDGTVVEGLAVPPDPFLVDEAFRTIYSLDDFDVSRPERYDLKALTEKMRDAANARFGDKLVEEVLVEQFDYIDKRDVRRG
ncbi:hypothetical protein [Consotaella aegiceratis]|uniref:hypothetical protein n=1 Tax=Consotaella aegiceratis TaxID=3097961 RepID=UPI002F41227F